MKKLTLVIHPFFFAKLSQSKPSFDKNSLEETLDTYKKGIQFASNGLVVVYRASPYNLNLPEEEELFTYAQQEIDKESLHFYIQLGEQRNYDCDEDGARVHEFIDHKLGEHLPETQLYGFGEDLGACVPWNLARVRRAHQLDNDNKPIVLKRFCRIAPGFTFEERFKELERYVRELDMVIG